MPTISINWIIKQLLVKKTEGSLSDVVVSANWSCRASDGTYSAVLTGCAEFAPPSGSFTPYNELTEQQVLDWCYQNGVDKSAIEANVTAQIQNQINPPVVSLPLPWAAEPSSPPAPPAPVVVAEEAPVVAEEPVVVVADPAIVADAPTV